MHRRVHISDRLRSELIVIGAPQSDLLPDAISRIEAFVDAVPDAPIRDIAYTASAEASGHPEKIAIVAADMADLREKLAFAKRKAADGRSRIAASKGVYVGTSLFPAPGRTAFLFPGEGSQYPDMLRELALNFPACRAAFDAIDTAVAETMKGASGRTAPLPSEWVFPRFAPQSARKEATNSSQMIEAVIAADLAFLFLFTQLGIAPDAVMGVGVGEIAALECAGYINIGSKAERVRLLAEGFRLIDGIETSKSAPDAVMLSVFAENRGTLEDLLAPFGEAASISIDQPPNLFVVSAHKEALGQIEDRLRAGHVASRRISGTTKPFHTPLMRAFKDRLAGFFGAFVNGTGAIPAYSCIKCGRIGPSAAEAAQCAASQWYSPLNIGKTIEKMYDDGFRVFVELGARGTLTTSVAATLKNRPHLAIAANRGHRPDVLQLHHTLAELISHGADFNAALLHSGRNSQMLDFSHPAAAVQERRAKRIRLPGSLPSLSGISIPAGLVAPPPAKGLPPAASGNREEEPPRNRPCLDFAEILHFRPGESAELKIDLNCGDFPYLLHRSLSAGQTSAYDKNARGLVHAPLELLLEIMNEAALKLFPGTVLCSSDKIRLSHALKPVFGGIALRICAKALPSDPLRRKERRVSVEIHAEREYLSGQRNPLAAAAVILGENCPEAGEAAPLAVKAPISVNWKSPDLYPARLYSGEAIRSIREIAEIGENGLCAFCFNPPQGSVLRNVPAPAFVSSPVLLATASDALAAFHSREAASGLLHIPRSAERIEYFTQGLKPWEPFRINLFARCAATSGGAVFANAEILSEDGRLIARITGLENRVLPISPSLHRLLLNPLGDFFSDEIPQSSFSALPRDVVCRIIDNPQKGGDDEEDRLAVAAHLALSPFELEKWNEMVSSPISRRHEWLFGRIAAKDAVRKCLLVRYSRKIGAYDIRIESDEAGKPSPQGLWRKTCGAHMDISITHTPGHIVAAAAPNASLGIDIENKNRTISDDFASSAFSQIEHELAAESGDGATTLLRFWCAKEALSKALGTGLRYGAGDLCAMSYDKSTGKTEMNASRLWLNPFPHLRGVAIGVQTLVYGEIVLAVSILDPETALSETGPFLRWN